MEKHLMKGECLIILFFLIPDCEPTFPLSPSFPRLKSRNAGDVLNDIGSMLADLTDELDSMLHADQK